jgi:hypothetical protein
MSLLDKERIERIALQQVRDKRLLERNGHRQVAAGKGLVVAGLKTSHVHGARVFRLREGDSQEFLKMGFLSWQLKRSLHRAIMSDFFCCSLAFSCIKLDQE